MRLGLTKFPRPTYWGGKLNKAQLERDVQAVIALADKEPPRSAASTSAALPPSPDGPLAKLSKNLNNAPPDPLQETPADLADLLLDFNARINLAETESNAPQEKIREARSVLRRLTSLIARNTDTLFPGQDTNALSPALAAIGEVPSLQTAATIPKQALQEATTPPLPDKHGTVGKSKLERWKTTAEPDPTRGDFLEVDGVNTVRAHLREDAIAHNEFVTLPDGETAFLNKADQAFYHPLLLHADHLQPSAVLIERLQEMIAAMNDDPAFGKKMLDDFDQEGYFVRDPKTKEIYGTKWLYIAFHNSIQNLWYLLASQNSGGGKVANDPIAWLKETPIGKAFFDGPPPREVDKNNDILYTIDGRPLLEVFNEWFREEKKHLMAPLKAEHELHHTMHQQIVGSQTPAESQAQLELMLTFKMLVDAHRAASPDERRRLVTLWSSDMMLTGRLPGGEVLDKNLVTPPPPPPSDVRPRSPEVMAALKRVAENRPLDGEKASKVKRTDSAEPPSPSARTHF